MVCERVVQLVSGAIGETDLCTMSVPLQGIRDHLNDLSCRLQSVHSWHIDVHTAGSFASAYRRRFQFGDVQDDIIFLLAHFLERDQSILSDIRRVSETAHHRQYEKKLKVCL